MKTLTQHINESMQINESNEPSDKIILKNLTWEEASNMINKSGRDKESLEYNIGYAEYYKALERQDGYGNGYNSAESARYLEKAESILDDRAFKKNQTIRRKLKKEYLAEVFNTIAGKNCFIQSLSYSTDTIQKFELTCRLNSNRIIFEILHDSNKTSNSLTVNCTETIPSAKPLKVFQSSSLKDVKSKIEKYVLKLSQIK